MVSSNDVTCEWCGVVFPRGGPAQAPSGPGAADPGNAQDLPLVYLEPIGVRLEWFFAASLPIVAVAMAVSHTSAPRAELVAALASLGVSFVLSLYQIVESVDAQYAPVGLALVLCILFGAGVAGGVFAAIWLLGRRPECWTAIGLLAAHICTRFLVLFAAMPEVSLAMQRTGGVFGADTANLSFCVAVLGWALANFWRPLNE